MSALASLQKLSHSVRVYVPSTLDGDKVAHASLIDGVRDNVVKELSQLFGGATEYAARGGWFDGLKVVYEPVSIVESRVGLLDDASIDAVVGIAGRIKHVLSQQAVAIEVDGDFYLV